MNTKETNFRNTWEVSPFSKLASHVLPYSTNNSSAQETYKCCGDSPHVIPWSGKWTKIPSMDASIYQLS